MPKDDARLSGAVEARGRDEILRTQRQESPAYHACKICPPIEGEDDGDTEIDPEGRPTGRERRGETKPERCRRQREDELDDALDRIVDPATVIARDAAENDP